MTEELSKGFTGIEINGVRFSNIKEMLSYMNKQRVRIIDLEKENAELKDKLESAEDMIEEIVTNKAVIKVYNPYADDGTIKSLEIALNHWLQRAEQFLSEAEK